MFEMALGRLLGSVILLAGTAPLAATNPPPPAAAVLYDAQGKKVGRAELYEKPGGLAVVVRVKGLPPGRHGMHIHEVGRCDPPDFQSAGAHFNPAGKQHGKKNPKGWHAGDMDNLVVNAQGKGEGHFPVWPATLFSDATKLPPLLDADGAAIVIHAHPDDEQTDPAGNAGARITCGVLQGK